MPRSRTDILMWGVAGLLLIPLLIQAALVAGFMRPVADDFCLYYRSEGHSLIDAVRFWYEEWTGRITTIGLWTAVIRTPNALRWLMPLTLGIWGLLLYRLWHESQPILRVKNPRASGVLLSLAVIFATLEVAPNREQSIYWVGGITNYLLPLVLLTAYVTLLIRAYHVPSRHFINDLLRGLLAFSLPFIAAATAENAALLQIIVIGLLGLYGFRHKILRGLLIIGLAGAIIGLAVSYFAPGNAARLEADSGGDTSPILESLADSFAYTVYTVAIQFNPEHPARLIAFLMLLSCAAWAGWHSGATFWPTTRGTWGWLMGGSLVVCFGLMWATIAPVYYGLGHAPQERTRLVTLFIAVVWCVFAGLASGQWRLLPRIAPLILVALLVLGPSRAIVQQALRLDDFRTFAQDWDTRDSIARQQIHLGQTDLILPSVPADRDIFKLSEVTDDQTFWLNVCVAQYYQVRSIIDPNTPIIP